MCGIFGFLASDGRRLPSTSVLESVLRDLAHRGPDAASHLSLPTATLAHTRLALLDLHDRANQPMWDTSQRYCLLYNGEIYNFRQLRRDLKAAGFDFSTESDTEVLLYGLLHEGTRFLPRLEGMFAFALYDTEQKQLLLARDRFGIKPLVYTSTSDYFCFSSETAPLRRCLRLAPDRQAVAAYLSGHEPPTQGSSLFSDVKTLQSGYYMEVDLSAQGHANGSARIQSKPFFSLSEFVQPELTAELRSSGCRQLVDKLDGLIRSSVRKHMIADVPVGSLCSGGLDSALITAIAARDHQDIVLFHANVVGRKSELDAAEQLAKHLKLKMHTVDVDDARFLSLIPETVFRYEAPFTYHPNSVPFLAVAHLIREHGVKAILSGEGADEGFLGYAGSRRVEVARRCSTSLSSLLPTRSGKKSTRQSADPTCRKLLGYHLRTLMHRNDRLGMGASVEARFPYLDHDVVAFACNLSADYKIRLSLRRLARNRHPYVVKWILRQVAEQYLPAGLAYRRKRGFPTTGMRRLQMNPDYFADSWLQDELELSRSKLSTLLRHASQPHIVRMTLCDLWGRMLLHGEGLETVRRRFLAHATLMPE